MNRAPLSAAADLVQSRGRGQDTQLIHMTPGEVSGLQALAVAHGGSLTTNPDTGLPEAGFLSDILPTLAGGLLSFVPGIGPLAAAGIVGLGTGAAEGDLGKGLMAGLGAFGGASLGAGLGAGSVFGSGAGAAGAGAGAGAGAPVSSAVTNAAPLNAAATAPAGGLGSIATPGGPMSLAAPNLGAAGAGATGAAAAGQAAAAPGFPGSIKEFGTNFKEAAAGDQGLGALGAGKFGVPAAMMGLAMPFMGGPRGAGGPPGEDEEDEFNYRPFRMNPRNVYQNPDPLASSREFQYFDPVNPGYAPIGNGMAEGGEVSYFSDRAPLRIGRSGGYGGSFPTGGTSTSNLGRIAELYGMGGMGRTGGMGSKGQIPQGFNAPQAPTPGAQPPVSPPAVPPQARAPFAQLPQNSMPQQWGRPSLSPASMQTNPAATSGMSSPIPQLQQMYPNPYSSRGQGGGFAQGGMVAMAPGGFVMDARATSEFGNGSSNAGMEKLQQMGGVPIQGPGDGVSDSIPATIGGSQPAAVARDEVYFPPQAVEALGGTEQLYQMMEQAHAARQNAQRGGNTQGRW